MQNKLIKVGVIGLGKMGQNHLRVLSMLRSIELVFVYDVNHEHAARLAINFNVMAAQDLNTVLPNVDAVVICSPTITHADYIRLAAKYVKNIFVEKPLADTLAESEEVLKLTTELKLNVQVGFIERFNPALVEIKKILDMSEQVINIDFTRTNKVSSRITDVDVVADLMIHDIDLALNLNGPVKAVAAHGVRDKGMIGFASALLKHNNGRFSRILASRITDKKMRSIQATCTDMFIDCNLLRKEILILRQSETKQSEGEPYSISAHEETVEVRPQEALLSELQAFIATCNGEKIYTPDVHDGLNAMHICDQIQIAVPM